jgi:hypothetical protein
MKTRLAIAVLGATACAAFASAPAYAMTSSQGISASNPAESLPPNPNFSNDGACGFNVLDESATCTANVAQAISNGRSKLESLPSLSLNLTAFAAMTVPEQLFVIANVERVARGISPITGLTTQLDTSAQTGATNNGDPSLTAPSLTGGATIVTGGANWAAGTTNPLGSNYYWMYDDGPNSPNGDCTSPGAPGCWGHRDNILGGYASAGLCSSYGLPGAQNYMGAGYTSSGSVYGPSFAEIFIGACGPTPTDVVFTWQEALQLLGGGTGVNLPGPPQNLVAKTSSTRGVVLTWTAPASNGGAAIASYEVLRSKVSGKEGTFRVVSCTTQTCTFRNAGTIPGTTYFYKVEATNSVGTGPVSNEASATAR